MNENNPYESRRYFGIALDPIHIGTGGYRLGRVDNTIARDSATNLPIIFGSSIEGTARTYSAYQLIEDDNSIKALHEKNNDKNKDGKEIKRTDYLTCAGKSDEEKGRKQCGECEICVTYGYSTKEKSLHGMAQFSDARILFFPVHTMIGPVWVTSPWCLSEAGVCTDGFGPDDWLPINEQLSSFEDGAKLEYLWMPENIREKLPQGKINLGWLYVGHRSILGIPNAENWMIREPPPERALGTMHKSLEEILKRVVIVSEMLFHQIVNSNLEVRTSVSIDPQTGAAEEGALFTYEAIPRATVMFFDIVYNYPKYFESIQGSEIASNLRDIETIIATVETSLRLFEHLGLGGMGTRGFGRFKVHLGDENGSQKNL